MRARTHMQAVMIAGLLAAVLSAAGAGGGANAASSSVTVTLDVASATSITPTCSSSSPRAQFGTIQPGTMAMTTQDCSIGFGSSNDTARLQLRQRDGHGVAMAATGTGGLDGTFASSGTWQSATTASYVIAMDVVADATGGAYVVGRVDSDVVVHHVDRAGNPVAAFGGGSVTTPVHTTTRVTGAALQADGKLVVVGYDTANPNRDFLILRYRTDGTLDPAFGTGGIKRIDFSAASDEAEDVAIQSTGRIIVVGEAAIPGDVMGVVGLRESDGALDPTFGTGGRRTLNPESTGNGATAVAIDASDRIILANSYYGDRTVARLLADGTVDTGYGDGGDGGRALPAGTNSDEITDVAALEDGSAILMGMTYGADTWYHLAAWKATPTGDLDTTFGTAGLASAPADLGGVDWTGANGAVLPDGSIVVAGRNNAAIEVVRFTAGGQPLTRFGGDGDVSLAQGTWNEGGDATVASDGGVWVTAATDLGAVNAMVLKRIDGVPVPDYVAPWTAGTAEFGACLRALTGTATPDWPVAGGGACSQSNGGDWRPVTTAPTLVAHHTVATNSSTADLRFGVSTTSSQEPGTYAAPIDVEVIAP